MTEKTSEFEFFQNDGYDATIAAANAEFMGKHPGATITNTVFTYAYPGRPGEGRWVGMKVTYTEA